MKKQQKGMPKMVSIREAADMLGVTKRAIRRYVEIGEVASQEVRLGGLPLILVNLDHCISAYNKRKEARQKHNIKTKAEKAEKQ